jgi:6-phosphogluconolactonase
MLLPNKPELDFLVFDTVEALGQAAAQRLTEYGKECVSRHARFTVALSGGHTPEVLYRLLAIPPAREEIDWVKTYLFFGDERCVPPDHADSNYRMVRETLLDKVSLPFANLFRMEGENPDPAAAAEAYSQQLQEFFQLEGGGGPSPENFPVFDLVLLGMGPDGHTASLFPGTAALQERGRPVTANYVPKLNTNRLTLTAPTINRAKQIWFLVVGEDKAKVLKLVLEGQYQPQTLPSQLIQPQGGKVTWFLDKAAAAELSLEER